MMTYDNDISRPHNSQANSQLVMCRICYEEGNYASFVSPCKCNGSDAFVHEDCLNTWIRYSSCSECEICKGEYEVECKKLKDISQWTLPRPWVIALGECVDVALSLAKAQLRLFCMLACVVRDTAFSLFSLLKIQLMLFDIILGLFSPVLALSIVLTLLRMGDVHFSQVSACIFFGAIGFYALRKVSQQWLKQNTISKWRCNVRKPI